MKFTSTLGLWILLPALALALGCTSTARTYGSTGGTGGTAAQGGAAGDEGSVEAGHGGDVGGAAGRAPLPEGGRGQEGGAAQQGGANPTGGASPGGGNAGNGQECPSSCPGPAAGPGAGICVAGECSLECAPGFDACEGSCVDLQGNGDHCGVCGNACGESLVCREGVCAADCPPGATRCLASCVDLEQSIDHCGDCEKACERPSSGGSAVCASGECTIECQPGLTLCDGACVDLTRDAAHCGGCGAPCAGSCLNGVCCAAGESNCSGSCVNLQTSSQRCGSCSNACAAGWVCRNGSCEKDCGDLALCGTSCVNLATNTSHCQMCDRPCLAPPSNGKAICAGAAGCDIECNANSLRCGNTCCAPPPANAIATCSGTQCGVRCRTGYHACEGTSSPCYVDTDVQRCGTGCVDCRQLNAVARCNGSRCDNVCEGFTFGCQETGGKVGCGVWGFESRSLENWYVDTGSTLTDAWSGTLASDTTRSFTGTTSLALGFNGNGMTSGGRHAIELATKLCPSGGLAPWPARRFVFAYLFVPSGGSGPVTQAEVYWRIRNGNQQLYAGCDTPLTASSSWQIAECNVDLDPPVSASIVGLVFRVFRPWQGTIYLDAMEVQ